MIDESIGGASHNSPVALITGASRGIGRGIAIELARRGFDLILNYRTDRQAADEAVGLADAAAGRKGARILRFQADISSAQDREALVGFAQSHFSQLDLLVNNAGIGPEVRSDLLEASEESFDRLISVNLRGPYFLTQSVAKWMVGRVQRENTPEDSSSKPMIEQVQSGAAK